MSATSTTQNAVIGVTYATQSFPAGTGAVANIIVSAVGLVAANNPPSQTVPAATASVTFAALNPDTYTFSAQAVDANNNALGVAATVQGVVSSTSAVTLSIPSALTFTQP